MTRARHPGHKYCRYDESGQTSFDKVPRLEVVRVEAFRLGRETLRKICNAREAAASFSALQYVYYVYVMAFEVHGAHILIQTRLLDGSLRIPSNAVKY